MPYKEKQFAETATEKTVRNEENIEFLNQTKADKTEIPDVSIYETKLDHEQDIQMLEVKISNVENEKQNKLTAGRNIVISSDNVISAIGGGSGTGGGNVYLGDITKDIKLTPSDYIIDDNDNASIDSAKIASRVNGSTIDISQNESITGLDDKIDINFNLINQNISDIANNKANIGANTSNISLKENITDHNKDITNVQSLITGLQNQITELKNTKYVVGEYKWVKSKTPVINGWSKVDLSKIDGQTLVFDYNGTGGTTTGTVKSHTHNYDNNFYYDNTNGGNTATAGFKSGDGSHLSVVNHLQHDISSRGLTTTSTGGDINAPAGIYAELWIFVGLTETGETNVELANQWNAEINHNYKVAMELQAKKEQEMNTKQEQNA